MKCVSTPVDDCLQGQQTQASTSQEALSMFSIYTDRVDIHRYSCRPTSAIGPACSQSTQSDHAANGSKAFHSPKIALMAPLRL